MKIDAKYFNKNENLIFDNANLPVLFRDKTIDDFKILGDTKSEIKHNEKQLKKIINYLNKLDENIEKGKGLILVGPCGVGKTFVASIILKKAIYLMIEWNKKLKEEIINEKGLQFWDLIKNRYLHFGYFIQATTLTQLVFNIGLSEKELKLKRNLKIFTLLCIDDLTKIVETNKGNEISFLDDVIRYRVLMKKSTIITSQVDVDEFNKNLSYPLEDLLHENFEIIKLIGPSQRRG